MPLPAITAIQQPESQLEVLFVDSELSVAEFGKLMLNEIGYKVLVSNSSSDALEIYKKDPKRFPVVVASDIPLELSGLDLLEKILKINPSVKSILTSSSLPPDLLKKAYNEGIIVIQKPYSFNKILSIISGEPGQN